MSLSFEYVARLFFPSQYILPDLESELPVVDPLGIRMGMEGELDIILRRLMMLSWRDK
ncbi:aspartyl protease family protein [Corchorus olitorius]|uniref:Aspartyl protease family protein n=1 Tax=Corchorus olitorius TaxID=93759 RepID=A0A1R3GYM1_9ROSI|nr:aspartyl protease family protein [Corchorus olitorius]